MVEQYQIFEAVKLQLSTGVFLVEANAGTGKTYAIGMLFLRAVSELLLPVEKILVVTFTKAATEELQSRIRSRLLEARDLLEGHADGVSEDLLDWKQQLPDVTKALASIKCALYDIDRTQIFTIHSFCQRMLKEQAIESGELFETEIVSTASLLNTLAADFWRIHLYNQPELLCSEFIRMYPTPQKLLKSITLALSSDTVLEPDPADFEEIVHSFGQHLESLTSWWNDHHAQFHVHIIEALEKDFFKAAFVREFSLWWGNLTDFFSSQLRFLPDNIHWLSLNGLNEELNGKKLRGEKRSAFLDSLHLPDADVMELLDCLKRYTTSMRVALARYIRKELPLRMNERANLSYDELIRRVAQCIGSDSDNVLRQLIAKRYTMALIDEFQDTDKNQWHIFSSLFGNGKHYLFLIGDPKQAIYRFRGADIHSYFQAKQKADQILTLISNYRSNPYLVEEINRIFTSRSEPFYFPEDLLSYCQSKPAIPPGKCSLYRQQQEMSAFVYAMLSENTVDGSLWNSESREAALHESVAREIAHLVSGDEPVIFKTFRHGEQLDRQLRPSDMAILVRTNTQANTFVEYLRARGIPAIVASKTSVFSTAEATDLLLLLDALSHPSNIFLLKSALTLSWFGYTGNELHRLVNSPEEIDTWLEKFHRYMQIWQTRGFLSMIMMVFEEENIFLTLARQLRAERRITNIHHLIELLQEAANDNRYGCLELVGWLRKQVQAGEEGAQELRLESDAEAVQVLTIHGAKGLQFPVVFCPYLWPSDTRMSLETEQIVAHEINGLVITDLGSDQFEQRKQRTVAEDFAEQLRLLYVALTRAEAHCYAYWVDTSKGKAGNGSLASAFAYLLFDEDSVGYHAQQELLRARTKQPFVEFHEIPSSKGTELLHVHWPGVAPQIAVEAVIGRNTSTHFLITSYSGLAELSEDADGFERAQSHGSPSDSESIPASRLPIGAAFGNLVHDLLEEIPFRNLAESCYEDNLLVQQSRQYGLTDMDLPVLRAMLAATVTTPLHHGMRDGDVSFCLADISPEKMTCEMPFHLRINSCNTSVFTRLLAQEKTVRPLRPRDLEGFLTGFIDLFFEFDGKYYILDYKTNYLGSKKENYQPERLVEAMYQHNYGLQYWIYSLVIHRFLLEFLPGYSYEQHFGGVLYLFLRGMDKKAPANGIFFTRPDKQVLVRLAKAVE